MGRSIAYAGLVVVCLGILALLFSLFGGAAVLVSLASVLIGLGLLTFLIGVGVHLLNLQGSNG